ncbi:MAG TPA: phosphoribosyltransferase family protein [Opitutaceae bacterium]|nr:phosphoribosyltransferase family protein [Opitutaceae bacterium]
MTLHFRNRAEAGGMLAEKLTGYAGQPGALVLGLPRGGVPVADSVARRLGLPMDVFIVRKLGVPGHEELAMGAIASGGVCAMNDEIVASLQIAEEAVARVREREEVELGRRERMYRARRPELRVKGRTVILVDDGIATGATMRAAALALREQEAGRVVVAAPVAAGTVRRELGGVADEFVAVLQPHDFQSVGQWYSDFTQVGDAEVTALLAASFAERPDG